MKSQLQIDHTADVDLGLEASIQLEPFVLIVGQIGSVECNYLLVAENEIILESKSFLEAIFDVMGTYFHYNICYSKQLNCILQFFQSYILNIPVTTKKTPEPLINFIRLANSFD